MDLFHGTSNLRLGPIFGNGLLPGQRQGKWTAGWSARPDLVYLTDHWAAHYALLAEGNRPREIQESAKPVILKINVDPDSMNLFPDEDFVRFRLLNPESNQQRDTANEFGHLKTTNDFDPTGGRWREIGITWMESLRILGTVASFCVAPSSILGYHQINSEEEFAPFGGENGPLRPGCIQNLPYAAQFRQELLHRSYSRYISPLLSGMP